MTLYHLDRGNDNWLIKYEPAGLSVENAQSDATNVVHVKSEATEEVKSGAEGQLIDLNTGAIEEIEIVEKPLSSAQKS